MDRRRVRRKPYVKRTPRRKIRWKRVFVVLAILAMLLWGIGMACNWAYHAIVGAIETTEVVAEETAPEEAVQETPPTPAPAVPAWNTNALQSAIAEAKLMASRQTLNVLLIGVDDTAENGYYGQADSVVLFIIDPDEETASMISIPANTRIPIAGQAEAITLKQVYQQGGTPLMLRMIESYLGITIPYYAAVDHAVFTRVVDELGGVELYVEDNMAYTDSYDGYTIDLKKGYQTLDGEKAQQYIRYRDNELGEFGRMKRQHRFVKAMAQQHATISTLFDAPSLLSIIEEESDTNLTFYPLLKIAKVFSEYQPSMMFGELLPGQLQTDAQGAHWVVDQAKTDTMFRRIFKIEPPPEEEKASAPQPTPAPKQEEVKEVKMKPETTTNKNQG